MNKTKTLGRISEKVHKAITEEARPYRSVDDFLWILISNWKLSNEKETNE